MKKEELLKRIEDLETQNKMLKEKLKKRTKHKPIRTTKKEIINY